VSKRPSNELRSEFPNTNTVNTVRNHIHQINTMHPQARAGEIEPLTGAIKGGIHSPIQFAMFSVFILADNFIIYDHPPRFREKTTMLNATTLDTRQYRQARTAMITL
jgi:hypothetical protein